MAKVNRPNSPQGYRTPPELLAAVEKRFGKITFDLACTSADCVAEYGFMIDTGFDAFVEPWCRAIGDGLGWCNPPWKDAGRYARLAAESGCRVLLNTQLAPDANWYAEHVHGKALVLALNPRVPYLNPDGTPACVDKRGKALGINRPAMIAAYGFGVVGFEPWRWQDA